jgi:hypothetical protein
MNSTQPHAIRPPKAMALGASSTSRRRSRNDLAILFNEAIRGMIEQIEHALGRPAQFGTPRRHDDRPVDQDRVGQHEVDQLIAAPFRIGEPEFRIGRALFAQQRPRRDSHHRARRRLDRLRS